MSNEEIQILITEAAPGAVFEKSGPYNAAVIQPEFLYAVMLKLRNEPEADFDYLFCETCVDFLTYIDVVYHLESRKYKNQFVIKARLTDRVNPSIRTVSDIWRTAEYHEREAFDFFGVKFEHHPDMRRIFLEDEWMKGYPLRKDYDDPINIVSL